MCSVDKLLIICNQNSNKCQYFQLLLGEANQLLSRNIFVILIVAAVALFGITTYISYEYYGVPRCPACGMLITPEMDEHFLIYDSEGNRLHACCIGCVLRLLDPERGWDELHIETFCDYYGPDFKIIIDIKENGNVVEVTPETARILLGAKIVKSCALNRIAYNQTAVEGLLSNGYTQHTMTYQQTELPEGTPVLTVAEAAPMLANNRGIAYVSPSPLLPIGIAIAGAVILTMSIIAYKKLTPKKKNYN